MKGKMKVLSIFLAAAMTASMFAGCSQSGNPTTTPAASGSSDKGTASTASKDAGTAAPSGEVTEINWNIWASTEPTMANKVIPELNKKSEADIGVKVNFKWTTKAESLLTALQAGDKSLDVAFACAWWANYPVSAQKGYFYDITEKLPEVAPDLYKKIPEVLWTGMSVNGRIYGVPTWKDAAADMFWTGRKDILEGAGAVEDFKKTDYFCASMTPVLEKVKAWHDADPTKNAYSEGCDYPFNMNKVGLNPPLPDWDMFVNDGAIGVRIKDGNTKVTWAYDDADYIANIKTMKDWADRGLSNGKVAPTTEQEPTTLTCGTAQGWEGAQYTAWGGPSKGYETLINHRTGPYLTTGYIQGGANVIGASSSKVDASLKFLQYVNTNEEYRNMMAYGVEGVTYTAEEKNGVKVIDKSLGGDGWAPANFTVGTMDLLWPTNNLPEDQFDVNKRICDMVNTATASSLVGFNLNTDAIQTQITACASIFKEYDGILRCGAVKDVDATVAEFKKKMENVGMNDIIAECQKQVDAFLAAKA